MVFNEFGGPGEELESGRKSLSESELNGKRKEREFSPEEILMFNCRNPRQFTEALRKIGPFETSTGIKHDPEILIRKFDALYKQAFDGVAPTEPVSLDDFPMKWNIWYTAKQLLRKFPEEDYYTRLGVKRTASSRDIDQAFEREAYWYDPNRHSDIPKQNGYSPFQWMSEAHNTLRYEQTRKAYDASLESESTSGQKSQSKLKTSTQEDMSATLRVGPSQSSHPTTAQRVSEEKSNTAGPDHIIPWVGHWKRPSAARSQQLRPDKSAMREPAVPERRPSVERDGDKRGIITNNQPFKNPAFIENPDSAALVACDRGGREYNQDFVLYQEKADGAAGAAVDGMGGHHGGDIAARIVAEGLQRLMQRKDWPVSEAEMQRFHNQMSDEMARGDVRDGGACYAAYDRRGSVLKGYTAGDCRIMVIRNGEVEFQTTDQSTGSQLFNVVGAIHPGKPKPFNFNKLQPGDMVLVVTDFLTKRYDSTTEKDPLNKGAGNKIAALAKGKDVNGFYQSILDNTENVPGMDNRGLVLDLVKSVTSNNMQNRVEQVRGAAEVGETAWQETLIRAAGTQKDFFEALDRIGSFTSPRGNHYTPEYLKEMFLSYYDSEVRGKRSGNPAAPDNFPVQWGIRDKAVELVNKAKFRLAR